MEVRINKYLSAAGVCSRREADRLSLEGRVTIDGVAAAQGAKVTAGQRVCVDGQPVGGKAERILLAFYKPVGIVCTTTDAQGKNNIVDYIGYEKRIYPIGRLDKDSEGLILMTNDGEMMNQILRSANNHEKEYIVRVHKPVTEEFVRQMSEGVYLKDLDRTTKVCEVSKVTKFCFRIVLTQGLNRQIRRMCETFGYRVIKLKRVRIINIELGDLKAGHYREVTAEELEVLLQNITK